MIFENRLPVNEIKTHLPSPGWQMLSVLSFLEKHPVEIRHRLESYQNNFSDSELKSEYRVGIRRGSRNSQAPG
jgi:hypothetical protein